MQLGHKEGKETLQWCKMRNLSLAATNSEMTINIPYAIRNSRRFYNFEALTLLWTNDCEYIVFICGHICYISFQD